MTKGFVLSALRTPIGRFGGALASLSAVQLGTSAARASLEASGLQADDIDLCIVGLARQAGCGPNPARQIGWKAGLGEGVPAYTLNQACASGLSALMAAVRHIQCGEAEAVLVVGAESMSNVPYLAPNLRWGTKMGHKPLRDAMYHDGLHCPLCDRIMGETVQALADELNISRQQQDAFALESQRRFAQADWSSQRVVLAELDHDEHPRAQASLEELSRLKPVFSPQGSITAGNSSGITDGAAALVVASQALVQRRGLQPLAGYLGGCVVGLAPERMGLGPVPAIERYHRLQGDRPADYDWVEINEAFAAQVLACQQSLQLPPEKLNPWGGSIALGHPIGCSGARIAVTALHGLASRGGGRALTSLCVSGGMGICAGFEVYPPRR